MAVAASPLAQGDHAAMNAVLLDLDGTLSDSRPGIESCMRRAMAELGRPVPEDENLDWAIGPPTEYVFARLLGSEDTASIAAAVAVYRRHYAAGGWSDNTPYPGIAEALAGLAARYPIYLATSKRIDFARQILEHFGFARHFKAIQGAELDGSLSHKPEMIAHIVKTHGLDPARAVMVGDRDFDIAGAHANGMRALGVLWGYGSAAEFARAGADGTVARPEDLPAAVAALLG